MKLSFLDPAQAELQEAADYFEDRRPGLGAEFAAEVKSTIRRILLHSRTWSRVSENTRRCRLGKFLYALIYQIREDEILIVAVAHLRRKPFYWRDRIDP